MKNSKMFNKVASGLLAAVLTCGMAFGNILNAPLQVSAAEVSNPYRFSLDVRDRTSGTPVKWGIVEVLAKSKATEEAEWKKVDTVVLDGKKQSVTVDLDKSKYDVKVVVSKLKFGYRLPAEFTLGTSKNVAFDVERDLEAVRSQAAKATMDFIVHTVNPVRGLKLEIKESSANPSNVIYDFSDVLAPYREYENSLILHKFNIFERYVSAKEMVDLTESNRWDSEAREQMVNASTNVFNQLQAEASLPTGEWRIETNGSGEGRFNNVRMNRNFNLYTLAGNFVNNPNAMELYFETVPAGYRDVIYGAYEGTLSLSNPTQYALPPRNFDRSQTGHPHRAELRPQITQPEVIKIVGPRSVNKDKTKFVYDMYLGLPGYSTQALTNKIKEDYRAVIENADWSDPEEAERLTDLVNKNPELADLLDEVKRKQAEADKEREAEEQENLAAVRQAEIDAFKEKYQDILNKEHAEIADEPQVQAALTEAVNLPEGADKEAILKKLQDMQAEIDALKAKLAAYKEKYRDILNKEHATLADEPQVQAALAEARDLPEGSEKEAILKKLQDLQAEIDALKAKLAAYKEKHQDILNKEHAILADEAAVQAALTEGAYLPEGTEKDAILSKLQNMAAEIEDLKAQIRNFKEKYGDLLSKEHAEIADETRVQAALTEAETLPEGTEKAAILSKLQDMQAEIDAKKAMVAAYKEKYQDILNKEEAEIADEDIIKAALAEAENLPACEDKTAIIAKLNKLQSDVDDKKAQIEAFKAEHAELLAKEEAEIADEAAINSALAEAQNLPAAEETTAIINKLEDLQNDVNTKKALLESYRKKYEPLFGKEELELSDEEMLDEALVDFRALPESRDKELIYDELEEMLAEMLRLKAKVEGWLSEDELAAVLPKGVKAEMWYPDSIARVPDKLEYYDGDPIELDGLVMEFVRYTKMDNGYYRKESKTVGYENLADANNVDGWVMELMTPTASLEYAVDGIFKVRISFVYRFTDSETAADSENAENDNNADSDEMHNETELNSEPEETTATVGEATENPAVTKADINTYETVDIDAAHLFPKEPEITLPKEPTMPRADM